MSSKLFPKKNSLNKMNWLKIFLMCALFSGFSFQGVMAEDRGRLIVPHCWNSGIGISASAHLAIAIPHCPFIEYLPPDLTDSPLRTELADDGLTMTNGVLELPDKPGLGIELNFEALDKFRASEIIL